MRGGGAERVRGGEGRWSREAEEEGRGELV